MDFIAGFDKIAEFLKHPLVLAGFVLMLIFTVQGKLIEKGIIPTLDQKDGSMIVQLLLRYGFWLGVLIILVVFGLHWLGVLIILAGFSLQFYRVHSDKEVKKKNPPTSPT